MTSRSGNPSKRKLDPVRDPSEIYKSVKLNGNNSRHARVDDDGDDGVTAGPMIATEEIEEEIDDYGPDLPPDDEEGRFFGGGITKNESEILDYVDGQGDEAAAPEKIDVAWLRKTALNFEKRITKNAELRAKFEGEPQRFIASEADLDSAIKDLSILAEHTELYPEFVKLGCVGSLVGLLTHENTDIAIDAVEIIGELTDEDVEAEDEQWDSLVDALMDADLVSLLVSNFSRLDENDESDRNGVYFALGVIENVLSRPSIAEQVGLDDKLLRWLLHRVQQKEMPVTQNKQYAAELLAIIAQTSPTTRRKLALLDTVDTVLQLVSTYRKRDPEKGSEEEEYMEDLFEVLACIVDEAEGKVKFLEAEGVELCLIMLKDGKMSKPPALRLLDHAAGGPAGTEVCQKLVDAAGLKVIFTLFMKKPDSQILAHLLEIFTSLLRLLPGNSAERIRTLAKFVEKEYEKTDRLVKLRREYASKVNLVDESIRTEQRIMTDEEKTEMADEWLARRLEGGLFGLQTIDVILAWLVAEDAGARKKIKQLLALQSESLDVIKATLQEQLEGLDSAREESKDSKAMLVTLVGFLH